jgi:hypothetical protein
VNYRLFFSAVSTGDGFFVAFWLASSTNSFQFSAKTKLSLTFVSENGDGKKIADIIFRHDALFGAIHDDTRAYGVCHD